jgi:hypothetical protein
LDGASGPSHSSTRVGIPLRRGPCSRECRIRLGQANRHGAASEEPVTDPGSSDRRGRRSGRCVAAATSSREHHGREHGCAEHGSHGMLSPSLDHSELTCEPRLQNRASAL